MDDFPLIKRVWRMYLEWTELLAPQPYGAIIGIVFLGIFWYSAWAVLSS